ncbi:hypothetical protein AKA01nite_03410 [Alkalibacterium kapii]|uniref:Short-chain dehydrogenase n=1 Tax=Alkalibacterium kapii TaxID=426704 RepID=A0A511AR92_9LACT|nr:hypothetical protein AKA01nite_03410 [Alkalibacterium kapii]
MAKDYASELKGKNIAINAFDTGWIKTEMGDEEASSEPETVIPRMIIGAILKNKSCFILKIM